MAFYAAVLPNSLIRLSRFLVESIGFSMDTIMSSANNDSFVSSFPIWMPFIYFSCLMSVTRTYKTMLHRSGESGHPCLVPDLSGKDFSFCPLNMRLAVGFSYRVFILFIYFFLIFIVIQLQLSAFSPHPSTTPSQTHLPPLPPPSPLILSMCPL